MRYNEIVKYIEDEEYKIDKDYYYHAFNYNKMMFQNMITEGIKSPILLGINNPGYNGYFYVSLMKKMSCNHSIYKLFAKSPKFIISENIKTLKTTKPSNTISYPSLITNSFLPFRRSEWDDEYQKFLRILPKDILGIEYNLCANFDNYSKDYLKKKDLIILISIIKSLELKRLDLPIIDSSSGSKINKEKVKNLQL